MVSPAGFETQAQSVQQEIMTRLRYAISMVAAPHREERTLSIDFSSDDISRAAGCRSFAFRSWLRILAFQCKQNHHP